MTITEARIDLSQKLADAINESHLPPTMVRFVLADLDRAVAQLEEQQFQQALESDKGE